MVGILPDVRRFGTPRGSDRTEFRHGFVVLFAAIVVNARLVLYGAALASVFRAEPRWFRLVAPYFLTGQLYALSLRRVASNAEAGMLRWYYLTIGVAIWLVWVPAIALGVLLGPVLPPSWQLSFSAPLLMGGLLAPVLRGYPSWAAAVVGAAVSAATAAFPHGLGLLLGTMAGVAAAVLFARLRSTDA